MFGREREPIDWGPLLWPLLRFFICVCLDWMPLETMLFFGLLVLLHKPFVWAHSWWSHWKIAAAIHEWHYQGQRQAFKDAGILPRRRPHSLPRLLVIPCHLMVLSAVLQTAWAASRFGVGVNPAAALPPTTWVEAWGSVCALDPPPSYPRVPPDPQAASDAMEREKQAIWQRLFNRLQTQAEAPSVSTCVSQDAAEDDAWKSFRIVPGCGSVLQALTQWDDLANHVCNLTAFGPLGLMATEQDTDLSTAIVDTGASICVTPHKKDFVDYTSQSGNVMQGLLAGASIAGRGLVVWCVEVGGKLVQLKLRAVHVPDCQQRLLCPQQILQELHPEMQQHSIGGSAVTLHFPEGDLECPYNDSNLPEIKLQSPVEFKDNLAALNSCLIQENNHNLKAAQRELLKWHWKFGHLDLASTQRIL